LSALSSGGKKQQLKIVFSTRPAEQVNGRERETATLFLGYVACVSRQVVSAVLLLALKFKSSTKTCRHHTARGSLPIQLKASLHVAPPRFVVH
jgi:hypothetical protein